jgi:hypothetical protein
VGQDGARVGVERDERGRKRRAPQTGMGPAERVEVLGHSALGESLEERVDGRLDHHAAIVLHAARSLSLRDLRQPGEQAGWPRRRGRRGGCRNARPPRAVDGVGRGPAQLAHAPEHPVAARAEAIGVLDRGQAIRSLDHRRERGRLRERQGLGVLR